MHIISTYIHAGIYISTEVKAFILIELCAALRKYSSSSSPLPFLDRIYPFFPYALWKANNKIHFGRWTYARPLLRQIELLMSGAQHRCVICVYKHRHDRSDKFTQRAIISWLLLFSMRLLQKQHQSFFNLCALFASTLRYVRPLYLVIYGER